MSCSWVWAHGDVPETQDGRPWAAVVCWVCAVEGSA